MAAWGRTEQRRALKGLYTFALLIVVPSLLAIPLFTLLLPDPPAEDLPAWFWGALGTNDPDRATATLVQMIQQEPRDIRLHFFLLHLQLSGPARLPPERLTESPLLSSYANLSAHLDPTLADIGRLGIGCCLVQWRNPRIALVWLEAIQNRQSLFLDYARGRALEQIGSPEAELAYRREIDRPGYVSGAAPRLTSWLLGRERYEDAAELCNDPRTGPHIPNDLAATAYLRSGRFLAYLGTPIRPLRSSLNWAGFLGAVLISVVWIAFLRRLDLFETERLRPSLTCFLLGALAALGSLLLYNLQGLFIGLDLTGGWLRDLLYCILVIGGIEELVKLAPLLLMIRIHRRMDESVDYLIYASLSALGFAFAENLIRFQETQLVNIGERGMVSAINHLAFTSLIAYGLVIARYRKIGSPLRNTAILLVAAAIWHGLFDFFLLSDDLPEVARLVSVGLTLLAVLVYSHMMSNSLNQSEFFDRKRLDRLNHLRERLGIYLMAIVLFEVAVLAWKFGPTLTAAQFWRTIGLTWLMVYALSFNLTQYRLKRREWLSLVQRLRRRRGSP